MSTLGSCVLHLLFGFAIVSKGFAAGVSSFNLLSNNIPNVFYDTISSCTIRIISPAQIETNSHIAALNSPANVPRFKYPTYTVTAYNQKRLSPISFLNGLIPYFETTTNEHDAWRYSSMYKRCWSHMYLVDSNENIDIAVNVHFLQYDKYREEPKFIIFWDLASESKPITWSKSFNNPNSFSRFHDTRLVFKQMTHGAPTIAHLVCVICSFIGQPIFHLLPISVTEVTLEIIWRKVHQNLHGRTLSCRYCDVQTEVSDKRSQITDILTQLHNVSFNQEQKIIGPLGGLTTYWWYDHNGIKLSSYLRRSPSLFIPSAGFVPAYYEMMTVTPLHFLTTRGLSNALEPFQFVVWLAIIAWLSVTYVLVRNVNKQNMQRLSMSLTILMVVAPLTDRAYSSIHLRRCIKAVLLLHALVSFSVTVLYGGGIASSMSVLSAPPYPTNIKQLIMTKHQLFSITTDYSMLWIGMSTSYLGNELQHTSILVQDRAEKNRLIRTAKTLEKHFCPHYALKLGIHDSKSPVSCSSPVHGNNLDFSQSVTIVSLMYELTPFKTVFNEIPGFWVSPVSSIPQFEKIEPYYMLNNYFGRLAMPSTRAWWVSGMQSYWKSKSTKETKLRNYRVLKRIHNYSNYVPRRDPFKFEPASLESLISVGALFYCMYLNCVVTFLIEFLPVRAFLRQIETLAARAIQWVQLIWQTLGRRLKWHLVICSYKDK